MMLTMSWPIWKQVREMLDKDAAKAPATFATVSLMSGLGFYVFC